VVLHDNNPDRVCASKLVLFCVAEMLHQRGMPSTSPQDVFNNNNKESEYDKTLGNLGRSVKGKQSTKMT
jgi:hypothetical protein